MATRVHAFRRILRDEPLFAATLVMAALLMRILVPGGFMPVVQDGRFIISICTGNGPVQMEMHIPGLDDSDQNHVNDAEGCAFADLAVPMLGGADAPLLAAALLFAFVAALLGASPAPQGPPRRLRPPLRAPPAR